MKKIISVALSMFMQFGNSISFAESETDVSQIIKEHNVENISAIYLFRQGKENPEYVVLNNENRNEFLDKLAALVLSDSNDGTYGKIEFKINNSLPRKVFYISNAGFTQTDGNKILKYLNWNDVENILQYMNI